MSQSKDPKFTVGDRLSSPNVPESFVCFFIDSTNGDKHYYDICNDKFLDEKTIIDMEYNIDPKFFEKCSKLIAHVKSTPTYSYTINELDYKTCFVPYSNIKILMTYNPFLSLQLEDLMAIFLIKANNVGIKNILKIQNIYYKIDKLFEFSKTVDYKDRKAVKSLVDKLTEYEYNMQLYWGFNLSNLFHTYWNKFPLCQCPVADNDDRVGTSSRVYNGNCPIHGQFDLEDIEL